MGYYLERYQPIGAFENSVYEGVTAALDLAAASGARLHVATSKNERDARVILEHFGLAGAVRFDQRRRGSTARAAASARSSATRSPRMGSRPRRRR